MPDTPERLAERLLGDGQKSLAFFRSLTALQWEYIIYSEGTNWNIHQILAHFVSAEWANGQVIQDIVNGGSGAPLDFDVNRFNELEVSRLSLLPNEELLVQFDKLRRTTIQFVLKLSDYDLTKLGRHPFFGLAPVEDIVKLIYRHNQIHLRDVRRVLES